MAAEMYLPQFFVRQKLTMTVNRYEITEANPDGSIDLYFGPTAPDGKTSNWLQTLPGKGWWTILRLYNPLRAFFDKTWRPSEIEPI